MRHLSIAAAVALAAIPAGAAWAQDTETPAYTKGRVWDFAFVKTVDGHFDDYVRWLSTDWKAQQEGLKKAGYITDYKVLVVSDPRKDEPDLILATEYPNMAAFDHPVDEEFAVQKQIAGSIAVQNKKQAERGAIRTLHGDVLTRELKLK